MQWMVLAIIYLSAAICITLMRKIQPENKFYPVWAVFICVVFTVFLLCREYV